MNRPTSNFGMVVMPKMYAPLVLVLKRWVLFSCNWELIPIPNSLCLQWKEWGRHGGGRKNECPCLLSPDPAGSTGLISLNPHPPLLIHKAVSGSHPWGLPPSQELPALQQIQTVFHTESLQEFSRDRGGGNGAADFPGRTGPTFLVCWGGGAKKNMRRLCGGSIKTSPIPSRPCQCIPRDSHALDLTTYPFGGILSAAYDHIHHYLFSF